MKLTLGGLWSQLSHGSASHDKFLATNFHTIWYHEVYLVATLSAANGILHAGTGRIRVRCRCARTKHGDSIPACGWQSQSVFTGPLHITYACAMGLSAVSPAHHGLGKGRCLFQLIPQPQLGHDTLVQQLVDHTSTHKFHTQT